MFIEFKQGEKHASKGADTSPFHEPFQDAGYLLEENDLIVDIDNLEKSKIKEMISYFDIRTQIVWTDRGAHLYFRKPRGWKGKSLMVCPLGFKVEYKTIKNTPNGITIKRGGKLRDIDNMGNREELPNYLYMNKNFDDLLGLSEGDHRDNKLYAHKFKLMTIKDYKKMLRFINSHILADPFNEDDFQRISREEEIRAEKNGEYDVAMQIVTKNNIVKYCNALYVYDGVRYEADEDFITIVASELKGQKTHYIDEVVKQMKYHISNVKEPDSGFDIKFKNGILRKGKFIEVNSSEFTPYYIDVNYNEEAQPVQIVDDFLKHLSRGHDGQESEQAYIDFLLEIVAHCLITDINIKRNKNFQRIFFFAGKGGAGKGTLFALIRAVLGKGNYKTNKLEQLSDERYIYGMKGMLANMGDDIEDQPIKTKVMSYLKSLSGYDEIELRKLFGMPINEAVTATQIFTSNHILKSFEKGDAWIRRVVWCPMYVTPPKYDPYFTKKLLEPDAVEYFLKLVMDAYFRLMENGDFTFSKKVSEFTQQYHSDNNSCLTWVQDRNPDFFIGKRNPELYDQYVIWAEEQGRNVQTKKTLKETILKIHGLQFVTKKVNGKTADVYSE